MKRAHLGLLFLLGMLTASCQTGGSFWFEGSYEEALQVARQQNKLILIDFASPSCHPCKLLGEQYFHSKQYKSNVLQTFIPVYASTADSAGLLLYDRYGVRGTPTVLLADAQGNELGRLVGYDKNPVAYHEQLRGELERRPFEAIRLAYVADSDGVAANANMARYYAFHSAYPLAVPHLEAVLADRHAASEVVVSTEGEVDVSALEIGLALNAYNDPMDVLHLVRTAPESPLVRYAVNSFNETLRKPDLRQTAEKSANQVLKLIPDDFDLHLVLFEYYQRDKANSQLAQLHAERMFAINPERMRGDALYNYARLLRDTGQPDQLLNLYGPDYIAKAIDAADAYELNLYAWFWATMGENLESALEAIEIAVKKESRNGNLYDTKAAVLHSMGRLEQAVEAEEKAVKLSPNVDEFKEFLDRYRSELEADQAIEG